MARCSLCNSTLPKNASFCPKCGTAAAGEVRPAVAAAVSTLVIVCPHCKTEALTACQQDGWQQTTCKNCKQNFRSLVATVRAKNSRGSWRRSARYFGVRVRHQGGEEYIEFPQKGYEDFELRSGDLAIFSYVGKHMILVQNLTIGQYRVVTTTWGDEMYQVGLFIGVVVLIAALYWVKTGTPIWQHWVK